MGRGQGTATLGGVVRGNGAPLSAAEVKKRLGELRPPKEFREFIAAFDGYYRDQETNMAEIVAAVPERADILKALDETALWTLTDRRFGFAGRIPSTSPNQKPLRALRKLFRKKLAGEYVDGEDFKKIASRFIYDTSDIDRYPDERAFYQEAFGWVPPKYKASEEEQAAVQGCQLVLCDYSSYPRIAEALSWVADGSFEEGFAANESSEATFEALIGAFTAAVQAQPTS